MHNQTLIELISAALLHMARSVTNLAAWYGTLTLLEHMRPRTVFYNTSLAAAVGGGDARTCKHWDVNNTHGCNP